MRRFPFDYHTKRTLLVLEEEQKVGVFCLNTLQNKKKLVILEPKSVLDQRSPSPPTSTFTDTAAVAAVSGKPVFKWPLPSGEEPGTKLDLPQDQLDMDWDTMLTESTPSLGQEQTFLRLIMGDFDDSEKQQHLMLSSPMSMEQFDTGINGLGFGLMDSGFGFEPNASASVIACSQPLDVAHGDKNPFFMPPAMFFHEQTDEKSQLYGSNLFLNQLQQAQVAANPPAFFAPLPSFSSSAENLLLPAPPNAAGSGLFPRPPPNQNMSFSQLHPSSYHLQHPPLKPKSLSAGDDAQALVDQLFKAAELVEGANLVGANGILARLNHQLPSPIGKPFLRSAFYFKEALQLLVSSANPLPSHHRRTPFASPLATPLDVVLKLSAYKAFSEVSPILQFTNFTATQALLEELGAADCVHVIDFDIGIGGQWSSFMQELAQHRSSAAPISLLKITAFVSPYSFHPLELHLTKENLSHFAAELNIPFEINIASIESFDPAEILVLSAGSNEAIAVNLPVGISHCPSFPTLVRLVKQLLPKIVISMDQGCDRGDLLFPHYLLNAFQSCVVLLDSFDGTGTDHDVTSKIEKFVLQPRIENCVIGRHFAAEKMLPWRTLFASAGFVPFQFSNFTETQAECLLKRVQVRGFHVEKRHASLYLYWQRGELASVSAWRC